MRFKNLTLALAGICVPALMLSAQTPTQHTFSFIGLFPTPEGKIKYEVYAQVPIYHWFYPRPIVAVTPHPWEDPPDPPAPEPPVPVLFNHHILIDTQYHYWYTPHGLFPTREITQSQAFTKGLTQAQLNAAEVSSVISVDRTHYPIKYAESSVVLETGGIGGYQSIPVAYRAQGTVVLNVTIPNAPAHSGDKWELKVTDALGAERYGTATLAPGLHRITITDIEAGNVLVSLKAMNANNLSASSYFQEAYALVRKPSPNTTPATINMEFASHTSTNRYRIGLFGVGHNSQRYENPLPLQRGREAMVRVMVYDAWGGGGASNPIQPNGQPYADHPVKITWSSPSPGGSGTVTFFSRITGYHAESGRVGGSVRMSAIGPLIPAAHVQPGLTVTAQLLQPGTNLVLDTKTISVAVAQPRTITLRGYDCRPAFGSGCPLVRDTTKMNNWILPFTRDVFPYSVINYTYKGKVWVPNLFGLVSNYASAVQIKMNIMQGQHGTKLRAQSETLYMGMANERYQKNNVAGNAVVGKRGLGIIKTQTDENIGYTIAHEMGHCFGLKHAPSKGASGIDLNYPYGGGGLAGGWGYTNIYYNKGTDEASKWKKHFLAENLHVNKYWHDNNDDALQIHWDVMSYTRHKTHRTDRFSDYNAEYFVTNIIEPPAPTSEMDQISGIGKHPGTQIWVYGPNSARFSEVSYRLLMPETQSLYDVDSYNNVPGGVPLDFKITSVALSNDPDGDGSGKPDLIVTRVPRLNGITSDN